MKPSIRDGGISQQKPTLLTGNPALRSLLLNIHLSKFRWMIITVWDSSANSGNMQELNLIGPSSLQEGICPIKNNFHIPDIARIIVGRIINGDSLPKTRLAHP